MRRRSATIISAAIGWLGTYSAACGQCDPAEIYLTLSYDVGAGPRSTAMGMVTVTVTPSSS